MHAISNIILETNGSYRLEDCHYLWSDTKVLEKERKLQVTDSLVFPRSQWLGSPNL